MGKDVSKVRPYTVIQVASVNQTGWKTSTASYIIGQNKWHG